MKKALVLLAVMTSSSVFAAQKWNCVKSLETQYLVMSADIQSIKTLDGVHFEVSGLQRAEGSAVIAVGNGEKTEFKHMVTVNPKNCVVTEIADAK